MRIWASGDYWQSNMAQFMETLGNCDFHSVNSVSFPFTTSFKFAIIPNYSVFFKANILHVGIIQSMSDYTLILEQKVQTCNAKLTKMF